MPSFLRGLLLLAMLLASAAARLDAEEGQKEREAEGLVPKRLRQALPADTADGAPEMPQNVQVMPQSSSIVIVLWYAPSSDTDVDHHLVYVENEGMEDTTEMTYYVWEGLQACTNYTFGVKAVSAKGDMSEPALGDGQTMVGIPPESQDLHVESYTHTTVTLAWEEPDTLCDIDHYRVKYSCEGSVPQETHVPETTVVLSDLFPETMYTFSVYASTSEGEGPATTVNQTTATDPGGPPQDLVAEGISSSAINVSWSAPYTEPSYYLVTAPPCMYDEEITYDLTYLIKNLDSCQRCYITVTSYYSVTSRFSATTSAEAKGGAPPPPKNCNVEVNENCIAVNWEKPTTPCVLGTYNVTWTFKKLWGSGEEESDSMNTTGLSHTVYSPQPYHNYTFEISASIEGVFGSPAFCSGISPESLPGPPVLLSVESIEQGVALVTWDSPAEENGQIIQYSIFVDNSTNSSKNVSGYVHNTTISLEPCKCVGISVEAGNNAGWGERSEVKYVTVVDDVLPEKLSCSTPDSEVQVCWDPYDPDCPVSQYNLKWEGDVLWSDNTDLNSTSVGWSKNETCYNISSTPYTNYRVELSVGTKPDESIQCFSTTPMAAPGPPTLEELQTENFVINVTWQEPKEKNGIISAYQVQWTVWNGTENAHSTNGNTFFYQIVDLPCGGKVDVTVRAKTNEFGEESPPRSVFLVNSVSSLTCKPTVPGVIALRWDVENLNCSIQEYNITWTFVSLWSEEKGSNWESVDGNSFSALLTSLPPYSSVSVKIHVDNAPEEASCTATTLEEPSSPPTEVHQIANDTNSVTVEWSLPEFVRGELHGWQLDWKTYNNESVGMQNIPNSTITTFQIKELFPSKTYFVYVVAVNGAGKGEAEVASVYTASSTTESHLGLILGVSIGGGILLILLLVGGFMLYNSKNKTKPPRSAPFMPSVIDLDDDKLYNKQHLSAANQRFQGKSGTIDFGTNRELYPDNDKARDSSEDVGFDGMIDGHGTTTGDKGNLVGAPGNKRLSQQVSSGFPGMVAYNRRPSQQVNIRMKNFEEYNRHSSQQDSAGTSNLGVPSEQSSHHEGVGRSTLGDFGRRPSQQTDLDRPSLKEFARRPSQQIDVRRPNSMEYRRRSSQQIDQGRPRLGEYSRRPSQQIDLDRPNLREYGKRPSQQIDLGRPRSGEYARRRSQQVGIGRRSYPSRSPQQPMPARAAYDHYRRRPSQQADIGMPGDRAFLRRPSQQFIMNFDGIRE